MHLCVRVYRGQIWLAFCTKELAIDALFFFFKTRDCKQVDNEARIFGESLRCEGQSVFFLTGRKAQKWQQQHQQMRLHCCLFLALYKE